MRKNLHKFSLVFGLFLILMGTAQGQNGELILATPDLSTWTCEVGEVNTFIWKYNYTEDGFDKQCDDINPASVNLDFGASADNVQVVGGPSVSGCFISLNFICTTDDPLELNLCVNSIDPFQANGATDDPEDDGIGCFDLMDFVMPVEMVFFNANINNGKTVLTWQTASEVDNEGFEVQKSSDGTNFTDLGFVNSTRSTGLKDYRYVDNNPISGTNYYRLKQMDYNGDFTYTNIVSVKNLNEVVPVNIYPNPIAANEIVNVFVDSQNTTNAKVSVYSISGAIISTTTHYLNDGLNKLSVETSNLVEGLYILSVDMDSKVYNKRLVIQ